MMRLINKITVNVVLLCAMSAACAACAETLTWNECVDQARAMNPELSAARQKVEQAGADRSIAASNLLPEVNADLEAVKSENEPAENAARTGSVAGRSGKSDDVSYGITAKQLVFDSFKTPFDIAAASRDLAAARYAYSVTSSDVRLRLRAAFAELLRAQELIGITEEIAARRKQNLELVKLRYEGGREHKGSLLFAEADLAQAAFDVTEAGRNLTLSQRRILKEIGRTAFELVGADGDLVTELSYSAKPGFDALADNTPFLRELIANKEASRFRLNSSVADLFPQVYLNASAGKTGDRFLPDRDEWTMGVSFSMPFFDGGERVSKITKSKALLREKEAAERSGRDTVLTTLEAAWKDMLDAAELVVVRRKYLEASEERARITRAQYENGLTNFDDWTIIESELVRSKKAFLDAQADSLIAEAYWVQAKGGTLEDEGK